jgi:hypothetical protein
MRPDHTRRREARGVINGKNVSESDDGSNASDQLSVRSRVRYLAGSFRHRTTSIAPIYARLTRRTSCAGTDLQCTGLNQPNRISWAMPRKSLRSVLTGIALKASRTCRVSSNLTKRPASSCQNRAIATAGRPQAQPARWQFDANRTTQLNRSDGSPPSISRTIRPVESTMQMWELSKDPSIPALFHRSSFDDAWSRRKPDSVIF